MHSENKRYYGLDIDALISVCIRNTSEDEFYHDLGMDPLIIGCIRNANVIMIWAWMLWGAYALTRRILS